MLKLVNQGKDIKLLDSYQIDLTNMFTKIRSSFKTEWEYEKLFTDEKISIVIKSQISYLKNEISEQLRLNEIEQCDLVKHILDNKQDRFSSVFERELTNVNYQTSSEKVFAEAATNVGSKEDLGHNDFDELVFNRSQKEDCVQQAFDLKSDIDKLIEYTDIDKIFKDFNNRIDILDMPPSLTDRDHNSRRVKVLENLIKEKNEILDVNLNNLESQKKNKDDHIVNLADENKDLKKRIKELQELDLTSPYNYEKELESINNEHSGILILVDIRTSIEI